MGLEAIYPKPKLSKSNKEHKKYLYLMKGLKIDYPDQAWAADISYLPMDQGFGYLFVIMDWYSRYVIEWERSNMLDTDFCMGALERSLKRGPPGIFNTDQGVQFTSCCFVERLEREKIRISMDGKGRYLDNIFVERLWRSVKYEDVYPKGYGTLKEAREGLDRYFKFYNEERRHQGLGYRRPADVYYKKNVTSKSGGGAPPPIGGGTAFKESYDSFSTGSKAANKRTRKGKKHLVLEQEIYKLKFCRFWS
ncbi:IS3 family transposase [Candidatus Neptunochlamydia vexilliferae]|uniref:Integrase catalytic domain-containing protein n=1 Tax=Candidatus Neptunichlamydia vexilliferae TaxID=1651774 RepID=A0ABS0B1L9_9BACT|nr:IS3 family transposase [Candidatus Neptunochlamydia vexilliferae]MBF5060289.1 hypothetical protein [Candidatus Neptunochlamydia vexilliferae]